MHHSGTELINPFKVLEQVGIEPGWHVADLGCGAIGHFVFPAAQLVGGQGKVYAVDIQKDVLRAIEKTAKIEQVWNVYPVWSDIDVVNAARIPSGSLDLTLVVNNLFLSQNREGLMRESLRLTKPGGRILVIEWKKEKTAIGPPLENRLDEKEALSIFRNMDLKLVRQFEAGDCHYALLFQRLDQEPQTEVLSHSQPFHSS